MGKSCSQKKNDRRRWRFKEQDGKCWYCTKRMELIEQSSHWKNPPPNAATFEHLDDRWSLDRGKCASSGTEIRVVLACLKCNGDRNIQRLAKCTKEDFKRVEALRRRNQENARKTKPNCEGREDSSVQAEDHQVKETLLKETGHQWIILLNYLTHLSDGI